VTDKYRTEGEVDMGQPVAWFEIISPDAERARKFYSELFGWKVDSDPAMGGYSIVDTQAGEGAIAGGIGAAEPGQGPSVKIYMRVDDIDGYLERAVALGGKQLMPPTDLPGDFGKFAVFTDPDGNQVGLWA
jgi:predicted enzyme related to lactoylglutathione lyase